MFPTLKYSVKTLALLCIFGSQHSTAFECTPSAFRKHLPSNARIAFVRDQPANATFEVPAGDIAYPTSPQGLKPLCAIQINVTSSASSSFSFGLLLPQDWNHRFLAVGNGGFAGGINWLDMAAGTIMDNPIWLCLDTG
jgi:feruloyl esterase